jgi:hypothetical protein
MAQATREISTYSGKLPSTRNSPKAVAVIIKPLVDLHGAPKNWETAARLYIDSLCDIPPELLAKAVKHAIQWNPFFPKPGDLRLSIRDELADHFRREQERRLAALPKQDEAPPPSPDDIAYVDSIMAELRGSLQEKRDIIQGDPEEFGP